MDFAAHEWMRLATAWVVRAAVITFPDGSKQLTPGIPVAPGAQPHYYGYWMRDGFYGSSNAFNLVNASMQQAFIASYEWMFAHPRADGILPQACSPGMDGEKIGCNYGQGAGSDQGAVHINQDLDTCAFAVKSLYVGFKGARPAPSAGKALFLKYKDTMLRTLQATTKDPDGSGMLWSNTSNPQVGYGFQDAEIKSGAVLYSSILYWNATRLMAEMALATGDAELASRMTAEAAKVQASTTRKLWNAELGMFMASTGFESRNVDVWGNAMAGAVGFTTPAQDAAIFAYFKAQEANIFYEGQVRETPFPTQWTDASPRACSPVHPSDERGTVRTYQNGGFWATPHHHVLPWLGQYPSRCTFIV